MNEWRAALVQLGDEDDPSKRSELIRIVSRHIAKLEEALTSRALGERPSVRMRELKADLGDREVQFIADASDEDFLAELYQAMMAQPGVLHLRPVTRAYWAVCSAGEDVDSGDSLLYGVLADGWRSAGDALLVRFVFDHAHIVGEPESSGAEEEFVRGDAPFIGAEIQIGDRVVSAAHEGVVVERLPRAVTVTGPDGQGIEIALDDVLRVRRVHRASQP